MIIINKNNVVKNYLPESLIRKMYENCFGTIIGKFSIEQLYGGLKNAVYLIKNDGKKIVLKVSPKNNSKTLTVDKNNMWWEAKMLEKMNKLRIPSPKLILFDNSGSICRDDYIFMSYIRGQTYSQIKEQLPLKNRKRIEYKLGSIAKIISSVEVNNYFLPSQPSKKFNDNYEFVLNLFSNLFNDLKCNNVLIKSSIVKEVYEILNTNKEAINNVKKIVLCATDMWDGNILIKNGRLCGIVDFNDVYFCDELMTFYFHSIDSTISKCFLKGYNKKNFSLDEKIRIQIYKLYVILKMIADCKIKKYRNFSWMFEVYYRIIDEIKKI